VNCNTTHYRATSTKVTEPCVTEKTSVALSSST